MPEETPEMLPFRENNPCQLPKGVRFGGIAGGWYGANGLYDEGGWQFRLRGRLDPPSLSGAIHIFAASTFPFGKVKGAQIFPAVFWFPRYLVRI